MPKNVARPSDTQGQPRKLPRTTSAFVDAVTEYKKRVEEMDAQLVRAERGMRASGESEQVIARRLAEWRELFGRPKRVLESALARGAAAFDDEVRRWSDVQLAGESTGLAAVLRDCRDHYPSQRAFCRALDNDRGLRRVLALWALASQLRPLNLRPALSDLRRALQQADRLRKALHNPEFLRILYGKQLEERHGHALAADHAVGLIAGCSADTVRRARKSPSK